MNKKNAFAFVVHPRGYGDILSNIKITKFFPKFLVKKVLKLVRPFVVSEITGFKSLKNGQEVKGWVIGIPIIAQEFLENRTLAKKRIIQAIKLAQRKGAKIVGLGALTSSVTNGGRDLINDVSVGLTTGNSLTAAVVVEDIKNLIEIKKLRSNDLRVAIIGATGSIGWAVSKFFLDFDFREMILLGRTPANLAALEKELNDLRPNKNLKVTTEILELKKTDIIIVATSASSAIIQKDYLKEGVIIYNITQPSNVSKDLQQERPDVILIKGGLVTSPIKGNQLKFGLPEGSIFSCLAETMLLAAEKRFESYSIGRVDNKKAEEMLQIAKQYNIKPFFSSRYL